MRSHNVPRTCAEGESHPKRSASTCAFPSFFQCSVRSFTRGRRPGFANLNGGGGGRGADVIGGGGGDLNLDARTWGDDGSHVGVSINTGRFAVGGWTERT